MAINVLLVFWGAFLGVLTRAALCIFFPTPAGNFPFTILAINLTGCFLLGYITTLLVRSLGNTRLISTEISLQRWSAFLGKGVLGGFTTMSGCAVGYIQLLYEDKVLIGFLYITLSFLLGIWAAFSGLLLGESFPHIYSSHMIKLSDGRRTVSNGIYDVSSTDATDIGDASLEERLR
ncbi:camphor resistance protein CrcB [Chlamydia trachomatis]|nr:camphor resistance protein CrcB [Chlamydia trachomatis]